MTEPEYRGLMASTWDFFRENMSESEDKAFFRELIDQHGQPVLDVGCGTGRLLLDYMADGIDVDGVDNSPDMLALCREKAEAQGLSPNVYEQWMELMRLPRKYKTIIVPSYTFQLITDRTKAKRAIKRFHTHLDDGGVLAVSFFISALIDAETNPNEWHLIHEKTRPDDGAIIRNWIRGYWDKSTQLQHTENRYEIKLDDEVIEKETIEQSPALRWYTQKQALDLFSDFKSVQIMKKYTFERASKKDRVFVVVAGK